MDALIRKMFGLTILIFDPVSATISHRFPATLLVKDKLFTKFAIIQALYNISAVVASSTLAGPCTSGPTIAYFPDSDCRSSYFISCSLP